jgi:hypothetical protein
MKDFTKISISERARCLLKPRKLQVAAEADKLLNEIVPVLYSAISSFAVHAKAFGSVTFLCAHCK